MPNALVGHTMRIPSFRMCKLLALAVVLPIVSRVCAGVCLKAEKPYHGNYCGRTPSTCHFGHPIDGFDACCQSHLNCRAVGEVPIVCHWKAGWCLSIVNADTNRDVPDEIVKAAWGGVFRASSHMLDLNLVQRFLLHIANREKNCGV